MQVHPPPKLFARKYSLPRLRSTLSMGPGDVGGPFFKAKHYVNGSQVWCPHTNTCWCPATVINATGTSVTVITEEGSECTFDQKDIFPLNDHAPKEGVENMVNLTFLHDAEVLHNLRVRFDRDMIYTFCGTILISVNPWKSLPIYTPEIMHSYEGKPIDANPPHIFALADATYRSLLTYNQGQSIVISGESGAGKTEATKLILQYLARVSGQEGLGRVEQQMLQSNPLLEAFGNAKTQRNDNSSRFGKFMKIHFNKKGRIVAASITNYLLEKSRIVYQLEDERNFHIFYQLCRGADEATRKRLHLGDPEEFRYLCQGDCTEINGINDESEWNITRNAMEVMGWTDEQVDFVLRIVSAVMHLGNLKFCGIVGNEDKARVENRKVLEIIAELLGVEVQKLETAMCVRMIETPRETFHSPVSCEQAYYGRDAFAKALYEKLFNWIVNRINEEIASSKEPLFIGLLDIYGFELFDTNTFEQFFINYANEKLQQLFVHHVFKIELEEYKKERINAESVKFVDNQICIDMFERKPVGMLYIMDDECFFPKATDLTLLEKLHRTHGGSLYYEKPKGPDPIFTVKHYAADVPYVVYGFLDKNKDDLGKDVVMCVKASKNKLVAQLFQGVSVDESSGRDSTGGKGAKPQATRSRRSTGTFSQSSVGAQFKAQLQLLISTLESTQLHFVRCIKPNSDKIPDYYDAPDALRQLRCSGVMDALRLRRVGFPIRFTKRQFYDRYRLLGPNNATCEDLLKELAWEHLDAGQFQMGVTKVFLRDTEFSKLEAERFTRTHEAATMIQKTARMFIQKSKYQRLLRGVLRFQATWHMFLAQFHFRMMRGAAITLQRGYRRKKMKYLFRSLRTDWAIRKMGAVVRGFLARRKYAKIRAYILKKREEERIRKAKQEEEERLQREKEEELRRQQEEFEAEMLKKEQERKRLEDEIAAKYQAERLGSAVNMKAPEAAVTYKKSELQEWAPTISRAQLHTILDEADENADFEVIEKATELLERTANMEKKVAILDVQAYELEEESDTLRMIGESEERLEQVSKEIADIKLEKKVAELEMKVSSLEMERAGLLLSGSDKAQIGLIDAKIEFTEQEASFADMQLKIAILEKEKRELEENGQQEKVAAVKDDLEVTMLNSRVTELQLMIGDLENEKLNLLSKDGESSLRVRELERQLQVIHLQHGIADRDVKIAKLEVENRSLNHMLESSEQMTHLREKVEIVEMEKTIADMRTDVERLQKEKEALEIRGVAALHEAELQDKIERVELEKKIQELQVFILQLETEKSSWKQADEMRENIHATAIQSKMEQLESQVAVLQKEKEDIMLTQREREVTEAMQQKMEVIEMSNQLSTIQRALAELENEKQTWETRTESEKKVLETETQFQLRERDREIDILRETIQTMKEEAEAARDKAETEPQQREQQWETHRLAQEKVISEMRQHLSDTEGKIFQLEMELGQHKRVAELEIKVKVSEAEKAVFALEHEVATLRVENEALKKAQETAEKMTELQGQLTSRDREQDFHTRIATLQSENSRLDMALRDANTKLHDSAHGGSLAPVIIPMSSTSSAGVSMDEDTKTEILRLRERVKELEAENKTLKALGDNAKKITELQQRLERQNLERKCDDLRTAMEELEAENTGLKMRVGKRSQRIAELEQRIARMGEVASQLEHDKKMLCTEQSLLEDANKKLMKEVNRLKQEGDEWRVSLQEAKAAVLKEREARGRVGPSAQDEIDALRSAHNDVVRLQSKIAKLEDVAGSALSMEIELKEVKSERDQLVTTVREKMNELEKYKLLFMAAQGKDVARVHRSDRSDQSNEEGPATSRLKTTGDYIQPELESRVIVQMQVALRRVMRHINDTKKTIGPGESFTSVMANLEDVVKQSLEKICRSMEQTKDQDLFGEVKRLHSKLRDASLDRVARGTIYRDVRTVIADSNRLLGEVVSESEVLSAGEGAVVNAFADLLEEGAALRRRLNDYTEAILNETLVTSSLESDDRKSREILLDVLNIPERMDQASDTGVAVSHTPAGPVTRSRVLRTGHVTLSQVLGGKIAQNLNLTTRAPRPSGKRRPPLPVFQSGGPGDRP